METSHEFKDFMILFMKLFEDGFAWGCAHEDTMPTKRFLIKGNQDIVSLERECIYLIHDQKIEIIRISI